MNLQLQIGLGVVIGLIIGFFMILNTINTKEKRLIDAYNKLNETLNIRYFKLKSVLNNLKLYMSEFQREIADLERLCDESTDITGSIDNAYQKLELENTINYKLEEIKTNMANYPAIGLDENMNNSIIAIAESEVYVGNAITVYNTLNLEYKVFIETFPISLVANIVNKRKDYAPFSVTQVEEFDDSYIDEDELP
ncbi:TPA: hypothetical protein IAA82_05355 [Candidatus Galligastranaerophilus gallistercoris]|nr:hypothetical protein [Candidatus Galligastranaerophilus gallistercoris]